MNHQNSIRRTAHDNNRQRGALSWAQRIGYGTGDMAQNLIYQTVSMYLLFFYTNIFSLQAADVATMFFIVRMIDLLWDPFVGVYVDRHRPRLGKYRSYLILGGVPLCVFAILCFRDNFSGSLIYAYVTYIGLSLCYTLVNVPYGALNASLTRNTEEITILTSTRIFLANLGGLLVAAGIPVLVATLSPVDRQGKPLIGTPDTAKAWSAAMTVIAMLALALLIFCFFQSRERVETASGNSNCIRLEDLWTTFTQNKPLRIVSYYFFTTFALTCIGNAACSYFITYNRRGGAGDIALFMALGTLPAFFCMPMLPYLKKKLGRKKLMNSALWTAIAGTAVLFLAALPAVRCTILILHIVQFMRSIGIVVATGYMWALIPEVVTYGEGTTGNRVAGIVNAIVGVFMKAGLVVAGVVPGAILALTDFSSGSAQQPLSALYGILLLLCIIPILLLLLSLWIFSKYSITDEQIAEINQKMAE